MKSDKQVSDMAESYKDRLCEEFGIKSKQEAARDLKSKLMELVSHKMQESFDHQFKDQPIDVVLRALKGTGK